MRYLIAFALCVSYILSTAVGQGIAADPAQPQPDVVSTVERIPQPDGSVMIRTRNVTRIELPAQIIKSGPQIFPTQTLPTASLYMRQSARVVISKMNPNGNSLAFVIDITSSMDKNIAAVIEGSIRLFRKIKQRNAQIKRYILVSFGDPNWGPQIDTQDERAFVNTIKNLTTALGGDCPEPSMRAVKRALEKVDYGSPVFLFTDAFAKDYKEYEDDVMRLAQQKRAPLFHVLFGYCNSTTSPQDNFKDMGWQVYERTAFTTNGFLFIVRPQPTSKMLYEITTKIISYYLVTINGYVIEARKTSDEVPVTLEIDVVAGSNTESIVILISGLNPTIVIVTETGRILGPTEVVKSMESARLVVYQMVNVKPGKYIIRISYTGPGEIKITDQLKPNKPAISAVVSFLPDEKALYLYPPFAGAAIYVKVAIYHVLPPGKVVTVTFIDDKWGRKIAGPVNVVVYVPPPGAPKDVPPDSDSGSPLVFITERRITIPAVAFRIRIDGIDELNIPFRRTTSQTVVPYVPSPCSQMVCGVDLCFVSRPKPGTYVYECGGSPPPPQRNRTQMNCPEIKGELSRLRIVVDEIIRSCDLFDRLPKVKEEVQRVETANCPLIGPQILPLYTKALNVETTTDSSLL